jgi:hypothetical protein
MEAYRAQNGLTQQPDVSSSATSEQTAKSSPLLVVRMGALAQGVPRERKYIFHPNMLQLRLAEGENPHPANYRGCRHAKEEMQRKKSQRTLRTTTGKEFSSNLTTSGMSFAAAL